MLILAQDKGKDIVLANPNSYSEKLTLMLDHPNIEEKDKAHVKDSTKNIKRKLTKKLKALKDVRKNTYKQYMET